MLSKCANPACPAPFLYLRQGKLFRWDIAALAAGGQASAVDSEMKKPPRRVEFFWLCNDCAAVMTLAYEKNVGIRTKPLARVRAVTAP